MSTIRESLYIMYNNISSRDFGIVSINMSSGLQEEPIIGSRSINKSRVRNRDISYFHGIINEPLTFTLNLTFESHNEWDETIFREVKNWLLEPQFYAPLIFSEMPDKIYYCLLVGQPNLIHTSTHRGYIQCSFECNASTAFSNWQKEDFDLSINSSGTIIEIINNSDYIVYPTIEFVKVSDGDLTFKSLSDGGTMMTFEDVIDDEIINIDLETDILESSMIQYRTDCWNGTSLKLVRGKNRILITGTAQISFIYQYKLN